MRNQTKRNTLGFLQIRDLGGELSTIYKTIIAENPNEEPPKQG